MRFILLLAALLPLSATAQTCAPNATQQAATKTLALQAKLLAGFAPAMESDVPTPLRPLIHDFKQSLIATVETALRCNNPEPAQLQSDLALLLRANKPQPKQKVYDPKVPDPTTGIYGADLGINVKAVPQQAGVYSIQISYGIECGADNILLVYRRGEHGYRRELVWQNPDLNSIGDAMGDFFLFAPASAPQPAFIVVYGSPWCSSNSSMLHADLVSLATPNTVQHRLDHLDHDYRRDVDLGLRAEPDGFALHTSIDSVSGDLIMRAAVLRYTTTSGHIVQQPVAPNAQAFVDMWLRSDWPVVQPWADAGTQVRLKSLHDGMTGNGTDFVNFGPTLACGGSHFQVELSLQADHTTANLQIIDLPSKYAQVRTNVASFTLLDITDKPDGSCKGPDLMQSRKH